MVLLAAIKLQKTLHWPGLVCFELVYFNLFYRHYMPRSRYSQSGTKPIH